MGTRTLRTVPSGVGPGVTVLVGVAVGDGVTVGVVVGVAVGVNEAVTVGVAVGGQTVAVGGTVTDDEAVRLPGAPQALHRTTTRAAHRVRIRIVGTRGSLLRTGPRCFGV
jgi:hypothetical protein